mmetsp:Transcript_17920/g.50845  ORF Transcript_17920/g.50845 Transcript_17920/m.50845 type:complete len:821 (+) Transcript_17920:525-2987(+)
MNRKQSRPSIDFARLMAKPYHDFFAIRLNCHRRHDICNTPRHHRSMVAFGDARKMGEQAAMSASSNYKNTIKFMKRLVGLTFDDPRAQEEMKRVPFKCVPVEHSLGGPTSIGVKVTYNHEETVVPIEAVCGMMIHHMGTIAAQKAAASTNATDPHSVKQLFPQDWVIAIPSYYTDAQRRALLSGCEIAGITGVQRLMHESTATALSYGIFKDIRKEFTKESPTNVMFIDMGASAYTVSIAAFEPGKLSVKSCFCDPDLGGRDFDKVIADYVIAKFVEKYSKKLSGNPAERPKVVLKIHAAAEKAKKTLSPQGVKEASINLECLMDDLDFNIKVKADDYEVMCQPLLARLEGPIKSALAEAKLQASDLSAVEIVGGSTRIGCMKRKLEGILGISLSTTMNADESVARGAALQSAILSPRFKVLPYKIVECQPIPVKISWDGEGAADDGTNSVVMFDRGLDFPIVRRVTLKRNGTFGVQAAYHEEGVKFGMAPTTPKDIAAFTIKAPAGEEKKVRVNVKQDIHGILSLSSAQMVEDIEEEEKAAEKKEEEKPAADGEGDKTEESKKKKVKRTNLEYSVVRPLDWTKEEINKANEHEVAMANNDRVVQETADMRNELESYIYDMRDKISSDSQLGANCTDAEKEAFLAKNSEVENWLYEDGFDATKKVYAEKLAELKTLGGPAEMRAEEAKNRPAAIASLQQNIEKYKAWFSSAQGDDKYSHITDEEFTKCHGKCDESSSWLYEMLDKQGSLPANVDPAFTVADVNAKNIELTNVCSPVMYKPVPKKEEPKKEEPSEKAEAEPMQTEETKTKEGDGATDMDVE